MNEYGWGGGWDKPAAMGSNTISWFQPLLGCGFSARVAMSLFGRWADLNTFQVIADLRGHFNVTDAHWTAFAATVGDFRNDVRLLSAFPRTGLLAGCAQAQFPDGTGFTPVQATQIGLVCAQQNVWWLSAVAC